MTAFLYSLSVILMIVLPLPLAGLLRRRYQTPWLLFAVGMATFTLSQIVHLPLNDLLAKWGWLAEAGRELNPPLWQTALLLGLTSGLCEELARVLGYFALSRLGRPAAHFGDGVMLGLGHGGIEAMIFGGVLTAATVSGLLPLAQSGLAELNLPAEQAAALQGQIDLLLSAPWLAVLPLLERMLAMTLHVSLSLLVLRAFQRRNPLYVLLAILYHAATNAALVYLMQAFKLNGWAAEGLVLLAVLPGALWALRWGQAEPATRPGRPSGLRTEWQLFTLGLGKELFQQWRTRRILVAGVVFGAFGMFSPAAAYFMPDLLKSIPGAEQVASLVPTPTVAAAMTQYIKNISQFGFVLAILFGMGAVAGEKERGTAALVLSKPMTRWAFLLSKLTAQALVYGLGLSLAYLGAAFYTLALFGALDWGAFSQINLLLYAWLLPYAALTLLGSVLGGTTSAAAGWSLGGIVALLLAGSVPQFSQLLPDALLGWAGLLGSGTPPPAAPAGPLAMSLALVVICLALALAVFEQQEF